MPSNHSFFGVVCLTHMRYFTTDEGLQRHIDTGCEIKYYGYEAKKIGDKIR